MASMKLLLGVVCLGLVAVAYCETPGATDAKTEKYHKAKKPETKEYKEYTHDDEPYFSGKKHYKSEGEYYEGKPSKPYYKPHTPYPPSPDYYTETPGYDPHAKYPEEYHPEEYHYSRDKDFSQKDVSFDLKEGTAATSPLVGAELAGVETAKTSIRTANVLGSQKSGGVIFQVVVGSVAWSGMFTKDSTGATKTDAEVNWLITFKITHKDWVGTIVAAGPGISQYSTEEQEFPIVGGAGVFEGATGRVLFKPLMTGYKYHFEMTLWPHKKRSDAVYAAASLSAEIA